MGKFRKFWYLTRREKLFFFEAFILLQLSNLSIKTFAFRHIESCLRTRWLDRSRDVDRPDNIKTDINLINSSLSRAASVFHLKSLCLSQSIAKLIMLRRRGVPAVLFAGVKILEDSSLAAHAWVHAGDCLMDRDACSANTEFTVVMKIGRVPSRHAVD